METELGKSSASKASQPVVYAIDFGDPGAVALTDPEARRRRSIIVRVELENVLFILTATEPERATRSFAEALAKQTAWCAIEKDIPSGVELPLSAKQIDQIPPEIENRLPDFYMNGNKAWLVGPATGDAEITGTRSAAA
jgi:hypothetical protein